MPVIKITRVDNTAEGSLFIVFWAWLTRGAYRADMSKLRRDQTPALKDTIVFPDHPGPTGRKYLLVRRGRFQRKSDGVWIPVSEAATEPSDFAGELRVQRGLYVEEDMGDYVLRMCQQIVKRAFVDGLLSGSQTLDRRDRKPDRLGGPDPKGHKVPRLTQLEGRAMDPDDRTEVV